MSIEKKLQQNSKKEHFTQLEWLRFFLGVYIILFHTFHYDNLPNWVNKLTEMGFFSTSTFFVLSGFLLAHVYLKNHTQPNVHMRESPKNFLIKRFSNLYPIHIGSLIITLVVVSLLPIVLVIPGDSTASIRYVMYDVNNHTARELLNHYMTNGEMLVAFVMNALMLQAWNPYYLTFNAPAWSISTLFFMYLLFPFIAPKLHRYKKPFIVLVVINIIYLIPVLYVISYTNFGMPETGILHRNPIIRIPEFAAGILLCSIYHRRKESGKKLSIITGILLGIFVATSLVAASYFLKIAPQISINGNVPYYLLHDGAMLMSQVALIFICINIPLNVSEKWQKIAVRFGGSSLPMFALHIPLYMVFSRVQRVLSGEPSLCLENFRACMEASGDKDVWFYPIFLIFAIVFCILFQEHFVVKLRKIIQNKLIKKNI